MDYGYGIVLQRLEAIPDSMEKTFAWRNDPRIYTWTRQYDLLTRDGHVKWFEQQQCDPTMRMYGCLRKGEFVGVCGLTSIDPHNQRAEFSLYIGPEHQGKDYGKAALLSLVRHGFQTLNLNCIWGETFDGNPAAKMFEEVGFVKEGTRRAFYFRDGKFIDCHLYSAVRGEWQPRIPGGRLLGESEAKEAPAKPSFGEVTGIGSAFPAAVARAVPEEPWWPSEAARAG